jgi:hypothetical protein
MNKKPICNFYSVVGLVLICAALSACMGNPAPAPIQTAPPQSAPPADELDAAIRETSDYLNRQLTRGNKLIILNVQSDFPALSEYIIDELIANTVNDRVFSVVDRQQLNTIRAELDFQMSGEVDDATAQSLGRIAGAQIIVSGAISRIGDLYRLRFRALSVQSAQIEGQFNKNIPDGPTVRALVNSRATGYGAAQTAATPATATTAQTVVPAPVLSPTPVRFTVTFNTNGASGGAPSAQTVQNGESITVPDVGAMAYSNRNFGGWNTRTDGRGTQYAAGDSFVVTSNSQLYAQWIEKVYRIGDTGPAGGIIFFDKGVYFDGWRYLEAAPADLSSSLWHENLGIYSSVKGTGTAVGAGRQNTLAIVQHLGRERRGAAKLCYELVFGGYDGWFLPSKDELDLMYINLKQKGLGGFLNTEYWSSSHRDDAVWYQDFTNGNANYTYEKNVGRAVRAIRQF